MFVVKKPTAKRRRKRPAVFSYVSIISGLVAVTLTGGALLYQVVEAYTTLPPKAPVVMEVDPNLGIELYVREFLKDNEAEVLIPIFACESNFKHFASDGTVLKNRAGSSAVGIAQILTSKHPDPKVLYRYNKRFNADLTKADFDITTLHGNLGYALVLYKVRGVRDWECAHH